MHVDPTQSLPPVRRAERLAVLLVLTLFVAIGLNNISHRAFIGQDFTFHLRATTYLFAHPGEWFVLDNTSRPLIYWLAIDGVRLTDNRAPFEFAAVVCILLNGGALALLHDLARRVIFAPGLRVAALAFIAFLPVTLITAVVFAADALTPPFFVAAGWAIVRWAEATTRRDIVAFAALAGVALIAGNFAKFTFSVLPAPALIVLLSLWRAGRLTRTQLAPFVVGVVLLPAIVSGWLWTKSHRELAAEPPRHTFAWRGGGEMTWRNLLLPKASDLRVFNAPSYWDRATIGERTFMPVLEPNGYSYPALLHLGIFTDVMDFALNGSTDNGAPRPEPQRTASRWAVRTGVVFSALGVIAVAAFMVRSVRSFRRPAIDAPPAAATVLGWFALAWYGPLALTLPFVHHAYDWGYWLPRLVIPAVWVFALEAFRWLDQRVATRPRFGQLAVGFTLFQTVLHVLVIWH
jgi:hypothetical protein